jgi:IS6 family transposase
VRAALHATLELSIFRPRLPRRHIALAVRWYVRYRLSYAVVSEWLAERGVLVDQSTIYRWVQRFLPLFGEAARVCRVAWSDARYPLGCCRSTSGRDRA